MPAYGRRPPKDAPALRFGEFHRGAPAASYAPVDYLINFAGWKMLGNDQAGDCVAVGWANTRALVTTALTGKTVYPDQDQVWAIYRTQNPHFDPKDPSHGPGSDDDQGMDMQTLCEYLVKTGGADGVKAVGFAKVDHTNLDEVRAAISIGGSLLIGSTVTDTQQREFPGLWTWDPNGANPGGHCTMLGGHHDLTSDAFEQVTWGGTNALALAFFQHAVEECWLIIWPEHLGSKEFMDGMDVAAFAAAYTGITGRPFPVTLPEPTPTPAPAPAPAPTPSPATGAPFPGADDLVAGHIAAAASRAKLSDTDWLNKHFRSYFK